MRSLPLVAVLTLVGCGPAVKPTPDAGTIDTSCGLDCVAQKNYGLLLNTCFEYADSRTAVYPPAVGVFVRELFTLEGGVKTVRVDYLVGGQAKMTDSFGISNGTLLLMRREFSTGGSVTFKNATNAIAGVAWLDKDSADGTHLESSSSADVLALGGARTTEPTTYRVTLAQASLDQSTVPAQVFDGGLQLLFNETPDHGSDGLRIWVPQVGFINFSSSFQLAGGTGPQYRLQAIRTIGGADAGGADGGDKPCSLGGP